MLAWLIGCVWGGGGGDLHARAGVAGVSHETSTHPSLPPRTPHPPPPHPPPPPTRTPQVTGYAMDSVQQRGRPFVTPGEQVYEGQVIGVHQRAGDLKVRASWARHGWGWHGGAERGAVRRSVGAHPRLSAPPLASHTHSRTRAPAPQPAPPPPTHTHSRAGQPLQEEAADQHARGGQGRDPGAHRARGRDPGLCARVRGRRRGGLPFLLACCPSRSLACLPASLPVTLPACLPACLSPCPPACLPSSLP